MKMLEEIINQIRSRYCGRLFKRVIIHFDFDEAQHPRESNGQFAKKNEPGSVSGGSNTAGNTGSGNAAAGSAAAVSDQRTLRSGFHAMVSSGKISTRLYPRAQNKHVVGTERYNHCIARGEHPSEVTLPRNEQERFIQNALRHGDYFQRRDGSYKIQYRSSQIIGYSVSPDGSSRTATHTALIHFSKDGSHIVPREDVV